MSGWENKSVWEDTSDMKAALNDVNNNGNGASAPSNGHSNGDGQTPTHNWVEKTALDATENGGDRNWEGNAHVYEWDGEEGDIGPEHPELERMLFGDPNERNPQGLDFSVINQIDVTQEGLKRIQHIKSFKDAGLHPAMQKNVEMCGYLTPTPIQRYSIPAIKMGYDLIAIAQTGSGKTAAYLIPILNHLMGKAKKLAAPRPAPSSFDSPLPPVAVRAEPLVVVVCPARELAIQIFNEARKLCYRTMLRPCVVYGGGPLGDQINQLSKGCDVLVASPGRLIDLMERPSVLTMRRLKYMVIDEADEMLHADWEEEFTKILSGGEQEEGNVKYMLFSATFPTAVRKLAKSHLAESHIRLRVGRIGSTTQNIKQDIISTDIYMKKQALVDLLRDQEPGRTIIFVNSKRACDEVDDYLFHLDMPVTSMHSDRSQREREDAMRAFRSGRVPILVTTGVTARGIDVRNIRYVINYDLPSMDHGGIQEYTHRIGRTGRIGHKGIAFSFYTERDEGIAGMLALTLLETNQEIPEFLKEHLPDDVDPKKLKFENDTDDEDEDEAAAGDGGWGGGGEGNDVWGSNDANGGGASGNDGWGTNGSGGGEASASGNDGGNLDWGGGQKAAISW